MIFIALLILTTLSIAGSAAFFSIYGLAQIFTGSFWPVVVMASSLEAGKLVGASFLYRYWTKLSGWLKTYLIAAVVVLMVITSVGIFGFLSAAYQQDILPLEQKEQKIALLQEEKQEVADLKDERLERKRQIDKDIASLPNNYITARQRLLESFGPELEQLKIDIAEYTQRAREITDEVQVLKAETLEQRVHTGPIIYIAKVFETEVDEATKWLILIIIFAFDPLAVALTIGANIAIIERKGGRGHLFYQPPSIEVDVPEAPPVHVSNNMSVEELEKLLEKISSKKKKLTPEQIIQKGMIEEMLAKKKVTEQIRNPRKHT